MVSDPEKVNAETKKVKNILQEMHINMEDTKDEETSEAQNLTKQQHKVKKLQRNLGHSLKLKNVLLKISKLITDNENKKQFDGQIKSLDDTIEKLQKVLQNIEKNHNHLKEQKSDTHKKAKALKLQTEKAQKQINKTIETIKKENHKKLEKLSFRSREKYSSIPQTSKDVANLAKACYQGALQTIPPDFCWKKGADFGHFPTGCPAGWERNLALCFQKCRSGFSRFAGVCWQSCEKGYKNVGASCWKSLFSFHFKKSYIPSFLTNFNSRIPCPDGMYKGGALCYRDCQKANMVNCGIGACASDSASCKSKITSMVVGSVTTIGSLLLNVVSFGSASALTAGAKQAIKKIGTSGLKKAFQKTKTFFIKQIKQNLKGFSKKITKKAKKFLNDAIKNKFSEQEIDQVCESTATSMESTMSKKNEPSQKYESLDFLGVAGIAKSCKNPKNKLDCAKGKHGSHWSC